MKKLKIFTIQPGRINLAGAVNFALFDKTGTLTVEGLDLIGILDKSKGLSDELSMETTNSMVKFAMAACHSLEARC